MKWIRRLLITGVIALLLFIGYIGIVLFAPNEWFYAHKFREAERIIAKIEDYQKSHGEYPANLSVIGIKADEACLTTMRLKMMEPTSFGSQAGKAFSPPRTTIQKLNRGGSPTKDLILGAFGSNGPNIQVVPTCTPVCS